MINVQIAGLGPPRPIEWAVPLALNGIAVLVDSEVSAIAVKDGLAGVAGARDGDPVREKVTGVSVLRALGCDGEAGEGGAGGGGGGDVGRGGERCWGGERQREGGEEQWEEGGEEHVGPS